MDTHFGKLNLSVPVWWPGRSQPNSKQWTVLMRQAYPIDVLITTTSSPFSHRSCFFEYRLHSIGKNAAIQSKIPFIDILCV